MRNNLAYLRHILDAILRIESYLEGVPFSSFVKNKLLIAGVSRDLEIIGEAANNVDNGFQKNHPDIPWPQMIALRNFLIHEYFGVSPKRIWQTVKHSLPQLKAMLEPLVQEK